LLTAAQYRNSLATLFPFATELEFKLEEDVALNGFRSIGAATVALSLKATETYLQIAETAAKRAFADEANAKNFTGCESIDAACADTFIASFGRKAFRRSLEADELSRYKTLYETGVTKLSSGVEAFKYVVMAILGSPHFLYRVELGTPAADGKSRTLKAAEIASKLAFFLANAPPDAELLDLAESEGLSASALTEQATRLLSASSIDQGVDSLVDDYLKLFGLESIEKLASAYPVFTPSLAQAMRLETQHNLRDAMLGDKDFRSIFDTGKTHVNQELAQFYGINGVTGNGFVAVDLPAASGRRGLLGNASVLSLYAHASSSSPTLRGKFVREVLLCQAIPAPPPGVDTALPDKSAAKTTRERYSLHATNDACATCHSQMDPIGLGLENFDAIGQYRAEENGIGIDASGELDGVTFTDAAGLASALAKHPDAMDCFTRSVFRYAWGRLENDSDEPLVAKLHARFQASSFQVRTLLLETVAAPEFSRVGELDQ
jgi:hypothetical protein